MAQSHIGIQMLLIKPVIEKYGLYETLRRCSEIGYHYIEVSWMALTPEVIQDLLKAQEDFGIRVGAVSTVLDAYPNYPVHSLHADLEQLIAGCKAVHCPTVRIGILPSQCVVDYDYLMEYIREIDRYGAILKENGIDLYFHTHHMEFVKMKGKYVIDHIKDNTENIGFELDIHWIQRGGENPVQIIRRFNGRVRLLHLKDYRISGEKFFRDGFDGQYVEFAEVGEGNLPVRECVEAGLDCGCEFFFVEQDDTYVRDPLESLKISHDNLVDMGFGHLF